MERKGELMEFLIQKDTPSYRWNKHWLHCVGSCHAPMLLRTDCVEQLKYIHAQLGVQSVRFHGVLSDDMQILMNYQDVSHMPGTARFTQQSFRKVGLVYDNILACGMKPWVELSFMPRMLASGEETCGFFYGGNITPPADYEKWETFIRDFVNYLIRRYGRGEVETWKFEVWNEPNISIFWAGSKEDYFQLYEHTARAVKEADPLIQVGGPATSGCKWIGSFLEYCRQHEAPVDFISTHQYAGAPLGGVEESEDMEAEKESYESDFSKDEFRQYMDSLPETDMLGILRQIMPDRSEMDDLSSVEFRNHAKWVRETVGDLPVYFSEWNENAIFSAWTNDTRKPAAYGVKAALDVEGLVTGSSVWCYTDIFEEFSNFPQEFHGGFGLLTNNGIEKPLFWALKLLSQTAGERLKLGSEATDKEIGIAAFRDDEKLQILLFRQKMKNQKLPAEHAVVTVELEHSVQNVVLERIDETHANPYPLWIDMRSPMDMTREEIQKIRKASEMIREEAEYKLEDGKLILSADLGVNDIYMYTIYYSGKQSET